MGERSRYAAGSFCWVDLTTTDQAAAKAFYGGLFGWEAEDLPVGEGAFYSMQRLRGKDVAAISPHAAATRGRCPAGVELVRVGRERRRSRRAG